MCDATECVSSDATECVSSDATECGDATDVVMLLNM